MYVWNHKYNINHEELEEKISTLANELDLLVCEVEVDLEDLKQEHEDWEVDELLNKIKKNYLYNI